VETGGTLQVDVSRDDFWEGIPDIHRTIMEAGGLTAFNKKGETVQQESAPARPMTLAQKILARASGVDYVEPGMTVFAEVDKAITHELVLPIAAAQMAAAYGPEQRVWDKEKLLVTVDHTVQIPWIRDDKRSAEMAESVARFAKDQELPHAFLPLVPFTSQGICHVLFPEQGLIEPDILLIGTDSHTCTYGAYGALSVGVGTTDLTEVMASGRMWLGVPESIYIDLKGRMERGVYAKDLILHILAQVTMNGFTDAVVEFGGVGAEGLTPDDRSTVANMVVEGGGTCGLFPVGRIRADGDATFQSKLAFDLAELTPYVAPPYKPDNGIPLGKVQHTPVDVAWIGSCTGGKLEDLAAAAEVLEGERVSSGVRLIVSPATLNTMEKAGEAGYLRTFVQAGGQVVPPSCGACLGMGPGTLVSGEVGVFSSNRNFKGRAGEGAVYLASPATVAASAIQGKLADPRPYLT
jgi:homoaconitase/3-isopropylmalate dehydratase large subunit